MDFRIAKINHVFLIHILIHPESQIPCTKYLKCLFLKQSLVCHYNFHLGGIFCVEAFTITVVVEMLQSL